MLSLAVMPGTYLNEVSDSHECRLWGITASSIPHDVVMDDLVRLPNSLKALGASNPDGWGLAYYLGIEPAILRGQSPANKDPKFDLAADQVAGSGAKIAVGHIRRASSGIRNIPDPHPFERSKNGKLWLFCHNGGVDKGILINLIGAKYLAENPPSVGGNQNEWIDSELYFIYVLKCCEESNWDVKKGITMAVVNICNIVPGTSETLNFVLSDGVTLWGFRKGNTLYYYHNSEYSAVASQYPASSQGAWIALNDYYLITLVGNNSPLVSRLCCTVTVNVNDMATGRPISSAKVYLDGIYVGTTDYYGKLVLQTVSTGPHTIKATKTGYSDASTSLDASSNKTVTLRLKRQ